MKWPEPKKGIPEGHYTFTFNEEPSLRVIPTKAGESRAIDIKVVSEPGNYTVKESFVPWDLRYEELCKALNVEHGKDIRMEGASFEADVQYETDKKDPEKSWPRLRNITAAPPFGESSKEDGDIPF